MTSIPRFEYRSPRRAGTGVFARAFSMTNEQVKEFEDSAAFKHIERSIEEKFHTFNSDVVPISRRHMQRPLPNVFSPSILKHFIQLAQMRQEHHI